MKDRTRYLRLLALSVALTAMMLGAVFFCSSAEDSSAATGNGFIMGNGGHQIGTWSYDTSTSKITMTASLTDELPSSITNKPGDIDFSAYTVTAVGFSSEQLTAFETLLNTTFNISSPIIHANEVIGASGKIGTWSFDGTTLTLEPSATTSEIPVEIVGPTPIDWNSVDQVNVHATDKSTKAFTGDMTGFLTGLNPGVEIRYSGEMPNWAAANGNSWYFDCDHTLYLTSVNGTDLSNYGSGNTTIFANFYFVSDVTHADISTYTNGGKYLFKEMTNLKSISSNSYQSFSIETLYNCNNTANTTVEELHLSKVTSLGNYVLKDRTSLKVVDMESLNSIGYQTFQGCTNLERVIVSTSISLIDQYAFNNCTSLESINTLGTVSALNTQAFRNCYALRSITLPSTLTTIGSEVFYGSGLRSITIPDNCTTIGNYAFANCADLTSVTFGSGLQTLGNSAFQASGVSGTISFPASLTSIGQYAFDSCSDLEQIIFDNNCATVTLNQRSFVCCTSLTTAVLHATEQITTNESVFGNCPSLTTVDIDVPRFTVGTKCFVGCTALTSIDFSKAATTVGESAFTYGSVHSNVSGWVNYNRCLNLNTVIFGNLESTISNYAFGSTTASNACTGLLYVTMGNVTSVGEGAFIYCNNLLGESLISEGVYKPLTFGSNLAEIKYRAFYGCSNLTGVTLNENCTITSIPTECFYNDSNITGIITIPKYVTIINTNAFYNCRNIQTVDIASTVLDSIENSAFYNCSNITTVTVSGNSLKNINNSAFYGCTNLTTFDFASSNLENIGYRAFYNCINLTGNYTFPNTMKTIGQDAFRECWSLGNIEFTGTSLTSIGEEAFYCSWSNRETLRGPASMIIPDSLTSLGNRAFYGCTKMSTLVLGWNPNNPSNLNNGTFQYCTGLTTAYIHDGVVGIGDNCFLYCYSLTTVVLGDTVDAIPYQAFRDCTSLTTVDVGDGVTSIGKRAFYNCNSLVSIDLNNVTSIGNPDPMESQDEHRVFYKCYNLETITARNVQTIYKYAFEECGKLAHINLGTSLLSIDENAIYYNSDTYKNVIQEITLTDTGSGNFFIYENGLYNGTTLVMYPGALNAPITIHPDTKVIYEKVCYKAAITGTVTIPSKVQSIGMYAFYDCNNITEVVLQCTKRDVFVTAETTYNGNVYNYSRAFAGCGAITKITTTNTIELGNVFNYVNYSENVGSLTDITITGTGASGLGTYYEKYYLAMPWYSCGNSGRLTVSFTGSISNVDSYMFKGISKIKTLNLCDSITSIGAHAFDGNSSMTVAKLPNNLTSVGTDAFKGCTAVTTLTCPTSFNATTMGISFTKLTSLTMTAGNGTSNDYTSQNYTSLPWYGSTNGFSLTFDTGVREIGSYAFYSANVKSITFNDEMETIGSHAFANITNNNFTTLSLPAGIETIGSDAFAGCTKLTEAYLPITFDYAVDIFDGCVKLAYFHFTPGVNGIGADYTSSSVANTIWAQTSANQAVTVYIESGVLSIGNYMFYHCSSLSPGGTALGISAIAFPNSLLEIGEHAFEGCSNMSMVEFGNSLMTIGAHAFDGCSEISPSIELPESLESIGAGAFKNCVKISSLTIPISVNAVSDNADPVFSGCTALVTYTFIGSAPGIDYSESASSDNYYGYAPWNLVANANIGFTDTTYIGQYMFYGKSFSSTSLKLPDSLVEIGDYAFANTSRVASIYNPSGGVIAGLTTIGAHAFENSDIKFFNSTTTVSLANITSVGESAFAGTRVVNVTVGTNSVPLTIGDRAFLECPDLKTFTVNGQVTTLPYGVFRTTSTPDSFISPLTTITAPYVTNFLSNLSTNFPDLTTVDVSGTTNFGNNAGLFRDCTKLTTVQMNTSAANPYTLPAYMFSGCTKLTTISLAKVNLTRGHEFDGCTSLTTANLTSATTIADYSFAGCSRLANISAPAVLTIGSHAFYETAIAAFTPATFASVQTIGEYAFANDTAMRNVVFADSVTTVSAYAFYGCSALDNSDNSGVLDTNNVTTIGNYAFEGTALLQIDIGANMASIGVGSFNILTLELITVDAQNLNYATYDRALYNSSYTDLIFIPRNAGANLVLMDGLVTIYENAAYHANITGRLVIPATVTSVGAGAFEGTGISELVILCTGADSISATAFRDCTSLTTLTLPFTIRYANVFTGSDNVDTITFTGSRTSRLGTYYSDLTDSTPNYTLVPWYAPSSDISVTFSSGIEEIDQYMFYHPTADTKVTSIVLPGGLVKIGRYAFANNAGITALTIPDSIETIDEGAFAGCSGITNLTVPIDLDMTIDSSEASKRIGITGLTRLQFTYGSTGVGRTYTPDDRESLIWNTSETAYVVIFGDGITSTGSYMYLRASSVTFPAELTTVGAYEFSNSTFASLNLTSGITTIGRYAFAGSAQLTSLTLPSGISSIGDYAFKDCVRLSSLNAPITMKYTAAMFDGCTVLEEFAFTKGPNGIGADYLPTDRTPWYVITDASANPVVTFSDDIVRIGEYMFKGCYKVVGPTETRGLSGTVTLPRSLESIGNGAFEGDRKVTQFTLARCTSLTTIGDHAFNGCDGISSITLGSSVNHIGAGAFASCGNITTLEIPINLNAVGDNASPAFSGTTVESVRFVGTVGCTYYEDPTDGPCYLYTPWYMSGTTSVNLESVTVVGDNMFRGCSAITGDIRMPEAETIGKYAFAGTSIVTMQASDILSIGEGAFEGSSVTNINMPNITSIPRAAFKGTTSLTTATFGQVTSVGAEAFMNSDVSRINSNSSNTIELRSVTFVGDRAFSGSRAATVTLGTSDVRLDFGTGVFKDCSNLRALTIYGTVEEMSADTFKTPGSDTVPTLVTLEANSVTKFSCDLSKASSLVSVSITGTTQFGAASMKDCTSLRTVRLYSISQSMSNTDSLIIPASMFENCTSLTTIDTDNLDLRNGREFYGCTSLTSVSVPLSSQIPAMSFCGCTNLTSVTAETARSIGTSAFQNCGLTDVGSSSFPVLETIGNRAFYGCASMTSFYFAASVSAIGSQAFEGTSLATITGTLENVIEIRACAFKDVSTLTGAISAVSATAIGDGAFDGTSVTSFTFGPGLATLGDLALRSPQLVSISFTADNPNFDMENGILFNEGKTTMIICPAKNEVHDLVLPDTLVNILHYAAYGSSLSGTLTLPESIRATAQVQVPVGEYAFAGSTGITGLDIRYTGAALTAVNAFEGCTGLTSLRVSNTVMLGGMFAYENRIASYTFFGGQSSGLENYYENNYQTMPWAFAADDVEISIVFESGSSVDKSMFRFASPDTSIVSVDLGPVSTIGSRAFMNCAGLRTLIIPDSVRVLDSTVLAGCSGLRDITLPISLSVAVNGNGNVGELSLTSLHFTPGTGTGCSYSNNYQDTLWYTATGTYNVYLDEGIVSIGNNMYLKPLENVTFPSTLRSIGANAFCNSSIDAVVLNAGLVTLGDNAFGNTPITRVTIPDSLVVSDTSAAPFKDCTQLASATLPITINYANHMFDGCTNLTSFTFTKGENGVGYNYTENEAPMTIWYEICQTKDITVNFGTGIVSIGAHMFHGSAGPLGNGLSGTVDLGGITSVGAYAFAGCSNMSEVIFGNAMTTIGAHAFENCTRLTSITLGSSVRSLANGTFYNCSSVRSLSVPASLDTVRNDDDPAFGMCTGIRTVELTGTGEGFSYSDAYGSNKWYQNTPWSIASNGGSTIALTIGNSVTGIGKNTFRGCSGLDGTVILPANVKSVGDYAFYECNGIDGLEIRFSLTSIGKGAFAECSSVRSLTLPISINAVYYDTDPVFAGTCNLESIHFTGTTGYVYTTSGASDYKLTPWHNNTVPMTVSFDTTVQSVGAYTFCECAHIQDTVNLRNITTIGDSAFQDCSSIRGVTADKLATAGKKSFEGCTEMTQASMLMLKVVPDNMFRNTESMSTLNLHPNCTTIGSRAFENSGVQTINSVVENTVNLRSVTSVGAYAFAGSKVVNVTIGSSGVVIGTFGDYVFYNCQYLLTVEIAGTVSTLPYNTFRAEAPMTYTPRLTTLTARKVTNFYANLSEFRDLETLDIRGTTSFISAGSQQYASFRGCTSLRTVTLFNESATSAKYTLPASIFEGCTELYSINLTYANISSQNGREFYGCTSLPSAEMLYTGAIADYSFYGCTDLTSINAPKASTVGSYAFANSGLTSIGENDLSSVTQINSHAFDSCLSLTSVTMNKLDKVNGTTEVTHGQTGAYTDVFYGCTSLTTVRMDLLGTITSGMFYGCDQLSSVTADKVKKIEVLAFYECGELASVSFPIVTELGVADATVTYVNGTFTGSDSYSVFYNCYSLSYVSMPKIESIGALAFYRCASLASFNDSNSFVFGDTVGGIGTAAFAGTGTSSVTIGTTAANGLKRISDYAFFACPRIRTFTSVSLTELPEHLFNNSDVNARPVESQLTTIEVPAATKFFANLHGITSLTTVRMTAATEFGDAIFYGCTGLSTVELKDSGTINLSARMFYNCAALNDINLEAVRLPVNTQILSSGSTFYGCTSLRTVTLNVCEIIPAGAFSGCTNLRTINLPNVTAVGKDAFSGCVALTTVTAPKLTSVEENGFYGCTSFSDLNPNDDDVSGFIRLTNIGPYAFYGCAFTKAVLGPQLTQMGAYAFSSNRLLNYVVLPNSLQTLNDGVFYGCPITQAYIASSITSIGSKAFDYGITDVTQASFYFNGSLSGINIAYNAINCSNKVRIEAYGTHDSSDAFDELCRDDKIHSPDSWTFTGLDFGIVRIDADDDRILPYVNDIHVLYGSKFVLPYYSSGTGFVDYYFATLNGGNLSLFANEEDFENGRVARSGDDVPLFPLEDNGGVDIRGFNSLVPLEGKNTITIITNGNGEAVRPESVGVHYGSLYTIPHFESEQTHISSILMIGAGNLEISISETTTQIYIGYAFNEISMQSADTNVTVYFIRDGVRHSAEVLLRSHFQYPDSLKDQEGRNVLEIPSPGYEFVGWYSAASGGYKAGEDTLFKNGQTWYARFEALSYQITVMDSGGTYATTTVVGPYVLYNTEDNLYYTDLNHDNQTLIIKKNDIEGYWIELYMDSGYKTIEVGGNTGQLVGDRSVVVKKNINYYTVNMQFLYNGSPVADDVVFTMNGWGIGSERTYTNASAPISNVPFTIFKNGLVTPAPLSDNYTLSQLIVNDMVVSLRDSQYVVDKSYLTNNLNVNFVFVLTEGQYAVEFRIGDDAGTVVNNGIAYSEHDTITMIADNNFVRVGYTFVGFRIAGHDGTLLPMTQIALTREMINQSQYCVVTAEGVWAELDYTIRFDLAGYTGANPPASIPNVIIGDTITLPDATSTYRIGQSISGWHFILGERVSTVSHSVPFVLDKMMIEGYADENRVITMQCEWLAKTYTVRVDPNAGTKQFLPMNNIQYGDTIILWDIGSYSKSFMMFGGWSIGEDGTKYPSSASARVDDELAYYGDTHEGMITFFFYWVPYEYSIQYRLDGGEGDAPVDNNVYEVNSPNTPLVLADSTGFERAGYSFVGWRYALDSSVIYINTSGLFESILAQNADSNGIVTLYAVWSQKEYLIEYNLKGGVAGPYAPQSAMYGEDFVVSAPTQSGFDFAGWRATTNATETGLLTKGAQYFSSSSYKLWDGSRTVNVSTFRDLCSVDSGKVTFEAMWSNASYSVSYDKNGGSGTIVGGMTNIRIRQSIVLPQFTDAEKTGYTFVGWSVDGVNPIASGTEFTTSMVEGGVNTVVFYAVWETNPYSVQYRYTSDQTYISIGTTYTSEFNIPTYERAGYAFDGWEITGADSNAYWSPDGVSWYKLGNAKVTGTYFKNLTSSRNTTVTINALWVPLQYRIAYSSNGGTGVVPVDSNLYMVGSDVTLKDYHVLDGTNGSKTVIGWSLDSNGSVTSFKTFTEGLAGRADATGTVNLYAVWAEGLCTVTIDLTGITVSEVPAGWVDMGDGKYSTTVEYGTSMKDVMSGWETVSLTKDGHTFTGWNYGSGTVVGNASVEPTFEEVDMSIAYVFGGAVAAVVVGIIVVSRFKF